MQMVILAGSKTKCKFFNLATRCDYTCMTILADPKFYSDFDLAQQASVSSDLARNIELDLKLKHRMGSGKPPPRNPEPDDFSKVTIPIAQIVRSSWNIFLSRLTIISIRAGSYGIPKLKSHLSWGQSVQSQPLRAWKLRFIAAYRFRGVLSPSLTWMSARQHIFLEGEARDLCWEFGQAKFKIQLAML